MKIEKIYIKKFRGFKEVEFKLGTHLTVIAGQNGTQKTTLLGLLTQPFTISDKNNPMYGEKPLSGENFKSDFSEKFNFSKVFDKIGDHQWTLFFDDKSRHPWGSIDRGGKKKGEIRIWRVNEQTGKKDATKGSGYIQLPVIYLSLKRLLPIGEDNQLKDSTIELTDDEKKFYEEWHNKILILVGDHNKITNTTPLESPNKQTLGANTSYYDWQVNSAGQDNIGKILLAILSFKRLKEKYPNDYKGGILAIDEVDTTFYPGSQIKLLKAFNKFASQFDIQIIFTTHSLTLLEDVSKYHNDEKRKGQVELIYLEKQDKNIIIKNNVDYDFIKNHLKVVLTDNLQSNKIEVFAEDPEGVLFAKSLLGASRTCFLKFNDKVKLGCGNLIELSSKISYFQFPNSIIILDGDVTDKQLRIIKRRKIQNIILMPGDKSPEQVISQFLNDLSESDTLWTSINSTFTKQYCFQDYSNINIQNDRVMAKEWFNKHLQIWGRNANKVLNPWKKANKDKVDKFLQEFDKLFNKF